MFNHASPTVGTTAPVEVIQIPAGETGQIQSKKLQYAGSKGGYNYGTALSIAVTTTHDGSTGPASTDKPEVIIGFEARP
jgi:hypothetical protein